MSAQEALAALNAEHLNAINYIAQLEGVNVSLKNTINQLETNVATGPVPI